jgi:hypothetical protein
VALALVLAAASNPAGAQLPFAVGIIGWERDAFDQQRRSYSSAANEYEVLFCVDAWRKLPAEKGIEQIIITRVRRERNGASHRIADVGALCVGDGGAPLPMIHTHSNGNCQFSPSDLVTVVARGAAFEGIQCGDRHFVWEYAWRVIAISTSIEQQRLAAAAKSERP